jgi:hypothetical protein
MTGIVRTIGLGVLGSALLWLSCVIALYLAPNLTGVEESRFLETQAEFVLLASGWLIILCSALTQADCHRHRLVRRTFGSKWQWVLRHCGSLALSLFTLSLIVSLFTLWRNLDMARLALRSSIFWPVVGLVPGLVQLRLSTSGLVIAVMAVLCAHIGMLGANFPLGSATVSTFDPSSARWLADGTAGIASLLVSLALARSRPN